MIKRIAVYGLVTGTAVVWTTFYVVDRAITAAVNGAWQKTP